ncbi:unnamed protein product [Chrysoparadoxa australica]
MSKAPPEGQVEVDLTLLVEDGGEGNVPKVIFIDDVDALLKKLGGGKEVPVETAIGAFNQLYMNYKRMEAQLDKVKATMKAKIPEIEKTLELVKFLIEQREEEKTIRTNYSLADTVYATAELDGDGRVCIWLGAGVMVEYAYEEALDMLEKNLANAKLRRDSVTADLEFLSNQSITVEVNMARIFNQDVMRRRDKAKLAAKK